MLYNLFENRDFVSVFAVALLAEGVDRNTFCSQNRTAENGSAVNGEDEAWAVADKAISYFKHAGQDDFLALGVAVVDVGQAQDRTTLLVDEAARRVGFDVQIRYTRIDERETASIEKIKI